MARGDSVQILQDSFELGIRRDRSKDRIGANAAWDIADYVVGIGGAPLRKRGAWEYKGTFGGTPSGWLNAMIQADFNGGRYNLAVTSSGQVYRVLAGGASWAIDGTTRDVNQLKQNPIFYWDNVFFPSPDGSQTMSVASETQVAEYTYNTASYRPTYLTHWKNRLVGAVGENLVMGPPGDPNQTWDDAGVYVQTHEIKALATVRSATMIFYEGHTDRLRGLVPAGYGNVTDDIAIDLLWPNIGCVDAFSVCNYQDMVIWADVNGVYMTDGAAPYDLTEKGGIKALWRDTFQALHSVLDAGNLRVAAGVLHNDLLHVSITNTATGAEYGTFVCYLPDRVWWRYTNCPWACYANAPLSPTLGGGELFAGAANEARVIEMSHTLEFGNASSDEDGTAVTPMVEFPYHRFSAGATTIQDIYIGYALEETLGASPRLETVFTHDPDPASPSYSDFGDGDEDLFPQDLAGVEATGYHYRRVPVRSSGASGIGVKVTQVGASDDTRLYSLSAALIPQPGWSQL